jgi:hypothetical protein
MDTDALIEALARHTRPVSRHAVERRLAAGLLVGAAAALALLVAGLGLRPDLGEATGQAAFWGKGVYTFALCLAGLVLTAQLARPDSGQIHWLGLAAAPPVAILFFAAAELAAAPRAALPEIVFGPAWICLPLILALATPIFGGMLWAFRQMAPTRLAAAGAAAGLVAGGAAATLYGLYCQQVSPTYILTRYTLAVALASAAGALLGPRLMRW